MEIYHTIYKGGDGEIVEKNPDLLQKCIRSHQKKKQWRF